MRLIQKTLMLLVAIFAMCSIAFAEGTKQMTPTASDTALLVINQGAYGSFASVGGPLDSRLHFRLGDPSQEQVYFGWSNGFADTDDVDDPTAIVDYYYRVLDPNGNVVQAWTLIDAASANLNSFAQVTAGPSAIAGAAGYTALSFVPAAGAVGGDYYVEISTTNNGTNGIGFLIPRFDITIATRNATPTELSGRVFSKNWALASPPTKDSGSSPYGQFDRPFRGVFYVYNPEGFVSKVDFLNAGFQPLRFNISLNSDGTVGYLDPLDNLKSVENELKTNAEFQIFLQEPPASLYPSGSLGTMIVNSDYPRLYGCAGGDEYYIEVSVTNAGQVEILIDEDGADDTFTYNTADRKLSLKVEPREGESSPYIRQVLWDGKDGFGVSVADNANLSARVTFSQASYHLPIYDGEYMLNGFEVTMVRPAPPAGYIFTYQWDDSDITEDPAVGEKTELEGCTSSCHTWSNFDYGDLNTINTYWFARREASTQSFNRTDPACGCGGAATLTVGGSVFDDLDGSKSLNTGDLGLGGVDVFLYEDDNSNGIIDGSESISDQTISASDGSFGFAVNTAGTPATADVITTAATDDGIQFQATFYSQFEWLGGYAGNGATTGLRFTGTNVPAYATITNAYIEVTGKNLEVGGTTAGAANVQLSVEIASSPSTYSGPSALTNRTRSVTKTSWAIPGAFTNLTKYQSPDLTDMVQELVSSGVYTAGDAISFIGSGTGGTNSIYSFEDGAANAPRLVIEYTDFDLPKSYIIRIDQHDLPSGKSFVTDTTEAVTFLQPQEYNCFNRFGVSSDRDGDGVADVVDIDNDNDGIPDINEDGGTGFSPTGDEDGDGILNFEDDSDTTPGFIVWKDENNDGVHDNYDADGDSVPDVYDLDSDNDGVADLAEAGGTDIDGDGIVDDATDADGDGLADTYDNNDTDGPFGSGADVTSPGTSSLVDINADGTVEGPDADGDGIPNAYDLDADNDGVPDSIEFGTADADMDGVIDAFVDADGDGLADSVDPTHDGPDSGNDAAPTAGTPVVLTGVDSGDGTPITMCLTCDADGDGFATAYDIDADGDGIADVIEAGGTDANGDGRVDNLTDADGDGLVDLYDPNHDGPTSTPANAPTLGLALVDADTDGDGIPNRLDRDSDNDGLTDAAEAGVADTDGDGIADTSGDTDGDGLIDALDSMHDGPLSTTTAAPTAGTAVVTTGADSGDGTPTSVCEACDADGDTYPNWLDRDADNDGIVDIIEAGGVDVSGDGRVDDQLDTDGDGLADVYDPSHDGNQAAGTTAPAAGTPIFTTGEDANVDGLADGPCAECDPDGDGLANAYDLDADNDGIPDLVEAYGADANGDGRVDDATDTDGDGIADVLDADNDLTVAADDGNGPLVTRAANGDITDAMVDQAVDFDGDGFPNWLDRDTDNDGISDFTEAGNSATLDGDNDARIDQTGAWDEDGDGLADIYDTNVNDGPEDGGTTDGVALVSTNADTDGDGSAMTEGITGSELSGDSDDSPNYRDLDSDDDGITDNVEQNGGSTSNDLEGGVLDGQMASSSTDYTPNNGTTPLDTDGDGVPDYLDVDADNDGIMDFLEAVCSGCPTTTSFTGVDADNDGVDDGYTNLDASNQTGGSNIGTTPVDEGEGDPTVDYLDLDTDGDLAYDWSEGFDNNGDGEAKDDLIAIGENWRANSANPSAYPATDTDGDGIPDWLDNLAGPGVTESVRPPFLDPTSGFYLDANGNGLADLVDGSVTGGTSSITPDENTDSNPDWRDNATAAPLPVELLSFTANAEDCDVSVVWDVATEFNVATYTLEYSADGSSFEYLRSMPAQGKATYGSSFTPQTETGYLRLVVADFDGSEEVSPIISFATTCTVQVEMYPNPVPAGEVLMIDQAPAGDIYLSDATGRVLFEVKSEGNGLVQLPTAGLVPGMYFVHGARITPQRIVVR